jgi:DNA-binding transcriptional LysR family regulator
MEWADRIGGRVKLRDVHILLAVAQAGSMAKAAERLAVSQPVISRTIADLERTLGARLLDRSRRGAEPTVYGRALLKHGVAAFDELRQGVDEVKCLLDPTAGEVRIGASEPMVAGLIPATIDRLSSQHPRINFQVTPGLNIVEHNRSLRERDLELVIGRLPASFAERDMDTEILFEEPLVVAAGNDSPWARRRRIELGELVSEPWVVPRLDSFVGSLVADIFHASGLEIPRKRVICTSIQMNNALLATNRYFAIYPGSLLRLRGKQLSIKALPVELPIRSTPVGIVTLKNRTLSPVVRLFIDYTRAVAKQLAKENR